MTMLLLRDGWRCIRTVAESVLHPDTLPDSTGDWLPAAVPGTVASALRDANRWSLDSIPDLDADDWWYSCELPSIALADHRQAVLRFEGLATVADIFLDGVLCQRSESMFGPVEADITDRLRSGTAHRLDIRFRALRTVLAHRHPRPRWKPRMIEDQNLRFVRTTLLGRMPSWSPPVKAVGPWRPIVLELRERVHIEVIRLRPVVEGEGGRVTMQARVVRIGGPELVSADFEVGGHRIACMLAGSVGQVALEADLHLPRVARWWPHTHGTQTRYPALLRLVFDDGHSVERVLNPIAFRELAVDCGADGLGFGLVVNGMPIFCRGACWSPIDMLTLSATPDALDMALRQVRDAGMNMLRVGGTMVYESDAFYERCDELGILVWQDFMFANMDYPTDDPTFTTIVQVECVTFLHRMQGRACVAVFCGGSEVEQQAAMLGVPRGSWQSSLATALLPSLVAEHRPDTVYLTNSPTGGTVPFQVDAGVGHYYGVGAYLRPLDDARRANVRFASECLAFSNVPEPILIESLLAPTESPVHHPRWKRGVPRDAGAGWDFEDVRDHYHRLLFGLDPTLLRYAAMERYLAEARVVTGEVMAATIAEWRRSASSCRGALAWLLRDLWPGAGWGLLDVTGQPKAAWYYLRRSMQPVTCNFTDEGLNGLAVHMHNEAATVLEARLTLAAYRGVAETARAEVPVTLRPHSSETRRMDACFDGFHDFTHAYRFGPPGHDVLALTLTDAATGVMLATTAHLPLGLARQVEDEVGLAAVLDHAADGWYCTVATRRFAQAVHIEAKGWVPDDNYFPLIPGGRQRVRLRPLAPDARAPHARISALNSERTVAATSAVES